jgi:hypothetical protein
MTESEEVSGRKRRSSAEIKRLVTFATPITQCAGMGRNGRCDSDFPHEYGRRLWCIDDVR